MKNLKKGEREIKIVYEEGTSESQQKAALSFIIEIINEEMTKSDNENKKEE